ncbi:unnamed protein product [Clonostachys rhizophaga]|uniref:Phospholipid-transporting ATPase n=1 Tax=Clonostachys rhizophaga TaxID=160324 RepID=A0A9N9YH27_9HYPO|nr:unnamed protein product [Clonostachys rhizophaga]
MAPYGAAAESPIPDASKSVNTDYDNGRTPSSFTAGMKAFVRRDIRESIRRARAKKNKNKRLARESWKDKLKARIAAWWQLIIIETILRRKPLPSSMDGRHIPLNPDEVGNSGLIDERSNKPYINNFIRSSRYTIFSFVPGQLIYQFSKLGNFYLMVIGIIQVIPGLSTVGRWTTIVPLSCFIAFSMLKEGYDDWRRYELDKVENRTTVWVLAHGVRKNSANRPKKFSGRGWKNGKPVDEKHHDRRDHATAAFEGDDWMPVQWQHVQVGDVVRLRRNEGLPADIALLYASGPNGIAYVDTMALDGETNLKSKQACPLFVERCNTLNGLISTRAEVVSEDPNLDLYSYDGKATVDGESLPLTHNNVVLRGSTLRNISLAIGLVINTGEECKIRMNANKNVKAKKPAMQSIVNKMVLFQIFMVMMLSMGLTVGYFLWKDPSEKNSFYIFQRLPSGQVLYDGGVSATQIFFGYLIMFNTLIPLSLYISLEIVKIGQFFNMQDPEMYDPVSNTPMVANTTTILEDLGQIKYIFSDKTGTLTENIMRFRKLSVAGVAALHDMDLQKEEEEDIRKMAMQKEGKGKAKTIDGRENERPGAIRRSTSRSQWRSSVHLDQQQEMKTEEILDYVRRHPNTIFSQKVKHFILCIALCHTCLPEVDEKGEIGFQAASPDELALVEAARDLGYLLIDRPSNSIKLQVTNPDGSVHTEVYETLDVIEFTSKRKRMSIIVRMPDGRLCVLCKGADNVIIARLRQKQVAQKTATDIGRRMSLRKTDEQGRALKRRSTARESMQGQDSFNASRAEGWRASLRLSQDAERYSEDRRESFGRAATHDGHDPRIDETLAASETAIFERCFEHIDAFASEGLRTLLFGYRYIDQSAYNEWKEIYREAETSLNDRRQKMDDASEMIEQNLELAGATAIEDKLQEGVPETIDKLRRASIKVWMLTGDKRETAIEIAHSARLCTPVSELYVLDSTEGNLHQAMTDSINAVGREQVPHSVLVIDGQTLATIDDDEELAVLFYDLVILVDSVICCRASPSQKAHLVKSIRRYVPKTMTLAIGDGANDIGMILEAHVGVGISGREGLQASRIADYAIAQFRFLQRLLFVHGRWNYLRTGKYVLATFWKEILFYIVQAHFQRWNAYTGTSLYESWSLTVFNVLFTSLAVIIPAIFDKDLSQDTLLAVPELYTFGQKNLGFNYPQYFGWATMGAIGSVINFFPVWAEYRLRLFTNDDSLYSMGVACFTISVMFINIKLFMLETHSKSVVIFFCFLITVAGWFMWLCILSEMYAVGNIYAVHDTFIHNFGRQLSWWVTVLLSLATLVVIELVVQSIRRVYFPTDQDLMQRIEKDADSAKAIERKAYSSKNGVEVMEMQNVGRGSSAQADEESWAASNSHRQSRYGKGTRQAPIQEDP